jgi:hypothetical protein
MAQTPKSAMAAVLSELALEDLTVDQDGKVQIANADLARRIADIKGKSPFEGGSVADSLNTGTCNNTACAAPAFDQMRRSLVR